MSSIKWELELELRDTEQYVSVMGKILEMDKKRNWGATEIQVVNNEKDPKMQGIVMTIYCMSGERLKEFSKILKGVEV